MKWEKIYKANEEEEDERKMFYVNKQSKVHVQGTIKLLIIQLNDPSAILVFIYPRSLGGEPVNYRSNFNIKPV